MHSKLLGGILLVVGATIGAGMLALPIATAELGFIGSLVLLIGCWIIMTLSAFLFLEVNLWFPDNSNFISMAGATLGKSAQCVAWVTYIILFYSILSAYVAGGGDLFHYLFNSSGLPVPQSISAILFAASLGAVVYFGIRFVDYTNRALMFGKMGAYLLLVILILPFLKLENLAAGEFKHILSANAITVTIVSFTCLMIIPSLRNYFEGDIALLKKAIFFGTLIPLICYIAWDMVIMGVIPLEGDLGLKRLLHAPDSNSGVVQSLNLILNISLVTTLAKFFTSICMATSFLSISLSLSDFLSDGLSVPKKGLGKIFIFALTFLPPVVIVIFYPNIFIRGIQYAGLCCFILMLFFPPLMAWRGRYHVAFPSGGYQVPGGKKVLLMMLLFASVMLYFGVKIS